MADQSTTTPGVQVPVGVPPEVAYLQALSNPLVPKIYASTFGVMINSTEISVLLGFSGVPAGVLTVSFPAAKTLGTQLLEAVRRYEEKVGCEIQSAEELEKRFHKP